jgi:hypothetical protein
MRQTARLRRIAGRPRVGFPQDIPPDWTTAGILARQRKAAEPRRLARVTVTHGDRFRTQE